MYENLFNPEWNKLTQTYNQQFQSSFEFPRHYPVVGLFYERKLTEYLYVQGHLRASLMRATDQSSFIKTSVQVIPLFAAAHVNWYPVKMIKDLKPTAANPLYIKFGGGASYFMGKMTIEADSLLNYMDGELTVKNVAPFIEVGLGYDLHFGKRLIVQPFFGYRLYPELTFHELNDFLLHNRNNGLEDGGKSRALLGALNFIILF